MGIKVKHSANMTSAAFSAAESGRAKRLAQDAALAKNTPQSIQTIAGAHAGAAPMTHASAPLTSASPGAGVHGAPLVPGRGGSAARTGVSSAGSIRSASGGTGGLGDYKITGTSIFDDPGDGSEWDPGNGGRWVRPWQPGEKEAEARRRVGEVDNELYAERELTTQGQKERAALVKDMTDAIKSGRFSKEEIPALMQEFQGAEENIRMADALRDRDPTPQEQFEKNTFTKDGIIFSRDGKVLYNPNEIASRRDEAAAKLEESRNARADKMELELRKPYRTTVTGDDGEKGDAFTQRTDKEVDAIMKKLFPERYPVPEKPTVVPGADATAQEEQARLRQTLKDFSNYRDK